MASLARLQGVVLSTSRRQGTAKASGNPYDFTEATVLAAGQGVTVVTYQTKNDRGVSLDRGDVVDALVEFGVYGGNLQCQIVSLEYPDGIDAASASLVAAS